MAFNRKPQFKKTEFEEVVLDIARVTRVVAGGKRLSFRATVIVGNKEKNQVGVGVDKGKDVAQAIQKASNKAKKNLVIVPIINDTIPHEIQGKYKAAKIILKPAQRGKGIIAGGAVRTVLKLANVPNAIAKILGNTSNAINNARVTILTLSKLKVPSKKSESKEKQHANSSIKKTK
ncbi:MAG: 30S ribosomal protein S5 [Candidatus Pacebacteria bacterium]|jgi:small subunit ribosomal protein S5|nr:30S ribosomal protein S5 [Candidatus Paceibacterota bacterium]MDD4994575.1 30S ribosomal protein S5 [Candidatus Paceibacterota bacterium]MDD5535201.1 30S ribosomal protein S5 [Candidatus Paceibacterota bacterium]